MLYQHPAVREAAVVGVPDAYRGETIKAVISLKAGHSVTPDEIKAFARERMAAYKYPRIVEIMDELPKTTSGKIQRRRTRNALARGDLAPIARWTVPSPSKAAGAAALVSLAHPYTLELDAYTTRFTPDSLAAHRTLRNASTSSGAGAC